MSTINDCIKAGLLWSDLPETIKATLNQDTAEYDVRVLVYFLQNQLEYSGELIRKIVRSERTYYRQLVQYSSQQMMLFPYHLQRKIVPGLNITPFKYYRNIVHQTMLSELSYDRLPNFTAADCFQILGIGRNEYMDLLNAYKGRLCSPKSGLIDTPSSVLDELLPKAPRNFMHLQPWFIVRVGSISNADVEANTPYVQSILDRIIDNDRPPDTGQVGPGLRVSEIPIDVFQNLYQRGLIYVEVPVLETDCLFVPTLAGFIMNRVSGDSYETLLYKIFVSLDPQSCVCQLAADLGVGLDFVINAASLFVRLGFACKSDSVSDPVGVGKSQDNASITEPEGTSPSLKAKKIAFVFDSSITAYLMLGNLSADLKKHSVTMFEVGKLTGDSLSAFYKEVSSLSHSAEQDVGIYYEHAKCLSQTMRYISVAQTSNKTDFRYLDLVRSGSLASLEPTTRCRILSKNYSLIVCTAPLSYEESRVLCSDWPLILGPPIPEICSPWFRLFISYTAGSGGTPSLLLCRGTHVTKLPPPLSCFSKFLVTSWGHDPVLMDIYALFYSINDLTANFPVLIQAYDDRDNDLPLHQHFLPLPISSDFLERMSHKLVWLERISKSIDITTLVGYLSLLFPDGKSEVDSEAQHADMESANEIFGGGSLYQQNASQFLEHSIVDPRVVLTEGALEGAIGAGRSVRLLSVHLGIPLFNSTLNDAIFERMSHLHDEPQLDLLPSEVRSRLSAANNALQKGLVEFIKSAGGVYVLNGLSVILDDSLAGSCGDKVSTPPLPLPSKSLCCSCEGDLEEWEN
uniref:Protein FAM91A1 n=2 Tax=Echinococcus granulosus TaxID=6210 RepID=A0A068W9I5_ECHGR|nr:protein FAM91A1 [Echinococcus granulosus]